MNKIIKELLSTCLYLAVVLGVTFLVITYVGQRTVVDGSSMEATLSDGDNLIVDKLSYRFQDPERYDIIVFPFQYSENTYYIKRIIGLPGEKVRIDEKGNIFIDQGEGEKLLKESYGNEVIKPENVGIAAGGVALGEDEYFVLGDNRNDSRDSRVEMVGNIHRDSIIGKAWVRIWPFDKFGVLKHK